MFHFARTASGKNRSSRVSYEHYQITVGEDHQEEDDAFLSEFTSFLIGRDTSKQYIEASLFA